MPAKRKRTRTPLAILDQNRLASSHVATSRKRQRRTNEDANIPAPTDIHTTQSLWSAVSRHTRIMSDRQTRSQSERKKKSVGQSNSSAATVTAADSIASSRPRPLRPHNPVLFKNCILDPRHITIDACVRPSLPPYAHFKTEHPDGPYRALPNFDHAQVFLDIENLDIGAIAKEYACMRTNRLCETEFRTFATETFFRGEKRSSDPPTDRKWRSERMLEFVCAPADDAHWYAPPVIPQQDKPIPPRADEYSWDIRPDCAYWLSTRGLNPDYVHNVCATTYVYRNWILSPYLTIEFKREDLDNTAAETQAGTAAALALYNRFTLYAKSGSDGQGLLDEVVHYAMVFTGPDYTIWVVRPNISTDNCWQGCTMSRLTHGDCTTERGVVRLVQWVNEIHRWGLGKHATGVEIHVKMLLQSYGVEVSLLE
ncbi:hypothetical protein Tdes44962_MAKER09620 [Teratosphaeria destructans]|uniref:Uncharacterized protein n=1 Tax=Teratosphaeria destructans TaxID=418781 RepID=A0A9W7SSY2_9PEZI|nr:hypothetical protein Tdes44962_MAKER09620 [Teratosphaeria destructans]